MFFKTDAERAAKQAAKARHDAGEAGASVATGARNLGAAALASLAEVTAPQDDKKGRRHARKTRAKALKLAERNRQDAAKAADKARGHGAKAAGHGRKELDRRGEKAGGALAAYAGTAGALASDAGQKAAGTLKEHGGHAAEVMRERTSGVTHVVADRAGSAAHSAAEGAGYAAGASAALIAALAAAAREKAHETRARALVGLDHGIDTAVPRAQEGVAAVGPRVDHLRDVINEELLPKLQAMLGDVQAGKEKALTKHEREVAALLGAPSKRKRKGGVLITFGLLAAAGAGVAYWLAQQSKAPATDPWAQPVATDPDTDPWASTAPTSDVSGTPGATMTGTGVAATAPLADAHLTDEELTTGSGTTDEDPLAASYPAAADTDATEGTTSTTGSGTTSGVASADVAGEVRVLESEEIDELARDSSAPVDEQGEGESPAEEIEAARAQDDQPVTRDHTHDGEEPDAPRA